MDPMKFVFLFGCIGGPERRRIIKHRHPIFVKRPKTGKGHSSVFSVFYNYSMSIFDNGSAAMKS